MAKEYVWDVVLRPYVLTKDDDDDQLAEVVLPKVPKRDHDIADAIIAGGVGVSREVILDILARRNKAVMDFVLEGNTYENEIERFTPHTTGVWATASSPFDPAVHKRGVDIAVGTQLRAGLDGVKLRVVGTKQ